MKRVCASMCSLVLSGTCHSSGALPRALPASPSSISVPAPTTAESSFTVFRDCSGRWCPDFRRAGRGARSEFPSPGRDRWRGAL